MRVVRDDVVRVADFDRFAAVATLLECAFLVGLTARDFEITVAYASTAPVRSPDRLVSSHSAQGR